MVKTKTLRKPRRSIGKTPIRTLRSDAKVLPHDPDQNLLDKKFILAAVLDCMKDNDVKSAVEILETHLEVVNKYQASKKNSLSRSTLYHALKSKNPTFSTMCKIMNCLGLFDS